MLIQPLPNQYLLASGSANRVYARYNNDAIGRPSIRLTAWMPDQHGYLTFSADIDNDDDNDAFEVFYQDNCRGCDYYFNEKDIEPTDAGLDEHNDLGNEVLSVTVRSCCPAYRSGLEEVHFPCAAGYDEPESSSSFSSISNAAPPMAYAIDLHPSTGERIWDGVWMQRINTVSRLGTTEYPTLNTYSDRSVCWGNDNTVPQTIPEMIQQVLDSPANEDLGTAGDFERNRIQACTEICHEPLSGSFIGPGFDAALLVHAAHQSSAYLLLRGSGFEADNGVIAVGLRHHIHEQDGQILKGYITSPGFNDLCWFLVHKTHEHFQVSTRALLLGQIPNPHHPCTSTEPSSSELAALAVS